MTAWQNGRVTGQPGGFAEPGYICAVQARPMRAHCHFAGKQEALSDRRCESIDVVWCGPQRNVRVRAPGKRIRVPVRHSDSSWCRYIEAENIIQNGFRPVAHLRFG